MLKALFDGMMERRSDQMLEQVGAWLPADGPLLDIGSGTGHLAARLERERGSDVIPADVTDMHVMGRPPVLIEDGTFPFEQGHFSGALLFFMLHYPPDPARLLQEAARVTKGPVIIVQTLYAGRAGYLWLRGREFVWTTVAFYVSKVIGYVPAQARFTMAARRFYTETELLRHIGQAGLRVRSRNERAVLPRGALVVSGWLLERDA